MREQVKGGAKMRFSYMILAGLLVSACATTDDPSKGGFLGGVQGLSSGAYDKRIAEREERLRRLQEMQGELKTEQAGLTTEKQQKQARLKDLRRRLSRLDGEIEQLSLDLNSRRSTLASDQARRDALARDLTALRTDIANAEQRAAAPDGSVRQLEAERDRLEEEYRLLLDVYLGLGQ